MDLVPEKEIGLPRRRKNWLILFFEIAKKTGQAFFGDCFFQIYYSMFASSHRDRRGNLGEIKNWQNFAALWLCYIFMLLIKRKAEAGLLNKSSCLAPALGVTKFILVGDMILVTLCCST